MVSEGDVVAVSAYMGGALDSGVLSSTGDVLEMSVVRGVGGVCDMCMCMCLARGGVEGVGTWEKWDMCLCFGCSGVGGRLGPGSGRVG